ncbi:MAG: hypothetical protein KC593_02890 [Myxococcales bacterium]|nr:hypothetical protein [Myxococcales bacterium]
MSREFTHVLAPRTVVRGSILSTALGVCLSAFGCGGGDTTIEGDPPIIPAITAIAPGDPTCPTGGVRVQTGVDDNRDGTLSADEVDQTSSVCNGSDVVGIEDNVLVRTVPISPGPECAAGGRRLDIGLDNGDGDGTAANATLEDGEVDTSFLDCNDQPMVNVVTPPSGPAGAFVLDTHGGAGTSGDGGDGGDVTENNYQDSVDAFLMLADTGSVDASCSAPSVTADLGDRPAEITSDRTLPLVASGSEGSLANGALYLREDNDRLLIWDATNMVGEVATGLRVAAGATLTLADNSFGGGGTSTLHFDDDVEVLGTIVTAANASGRDGLDLGARRVVLGASSVIDTHGVAAGANGGRVSIETGDVLLALGSINTRGADGPSGGSGGSINLDAGAQLYTGGTIVSNGGAGTAGNGGSGGEAILRAESRLVCNAAAVSTDGGNGAGYAGSGGQVRLGADCIYGIPLDIRSPGAIRTRGGAHTGACAVQGCDGGRGGDVTFTTGYGGALSVSGGLDTRGGNSAGGAGGDGGSVNAQEGYFSDFVAVVRRIEFSGNITTFGGDGATSGGDGGEIRTRNIGTLGSRTRFLGYASALLSGGAGATQGGDAGDLAFASEGDATDGGIGLFVYGVDVSAVGGASSAGTGGDGGYIAFDPYFYTPPSARSLQNAPVENFVVAANATLHGGSGLDGGSGGGVVAPSGCSPNLVTTGIRLDGTFDLDGGAATTGTGGSAGQLELATLRGSASVAGTVTARAGASTSGSGGAFQGAVIMGTPAVLSATVTASGGNGGSVGGFSGDVVVVSLGGTSSVSGTVTITGGTGGTPADNGESGSLLVDTGNTCLRGRIAGRVGQP